MKVLTILLVLSLGALAACSKQYKSAEIAAATVAKADFAGLDCEVITSRVSRLEQKMYDAKRELNSTADRNRGYQAGAAVLMLIALPFIPSNEAQADQYAKALGEYEAALEEAEEARCV